MMQGFGRDLSLAARRLIATPLFTVFAILSLAVGVGVTTAVYSVVKSIFLRDAGVADPATAVFMRERPAPVCSRRSATPTLT